jgi:hypothetical protein
VPGLYLEKELPGMTALAYSVFVDGTLYVAGTDSGSMPTGVADKIRNPAAWVGGTAPALTVVPVGKSHINMTDLQSATLARAALGIEVNTAKGHLVPTGSAPTVAAQAAAGTSPSAAIAGRDTAGTITLTSGTGTPATGNQVILTFNQAFATAPIVVLTPGSAALAALHPYVAAATTTTFTVGFGVAAATSTAYPINYVVIGK